MKHFLQSLAQRQRKTMRPVERPTPHGPTRRNTGSQTGAPAMLASRQNLAEETSRPILSTRYDDNRYVIEIWCRTPRQATRLTQRILREVLG